MTTTVKLSDLAAVIRSKNAGPYRVTFDVMFRDRDTFEKVRRSGAVSRESVASAFGVDVDRVSSVFEVPEGNALKFTLVRPVVQGHVGDGDIYGCQQHVPVMNMPVRIEL